MCVRVYEERERELVCDEERERERVFGSVTIKAFAM